MTTTASTSIAQDYALPNDWQRAGERLALLEACHDAATFHRAQALGVDAGWTCLEAGAGHGSVARWLAQQVGPSGRVVATDLDVTLLREIEAPSLEVRRLDLVADDLPTGAFDFVHTRLVLLHIPAREEVLRRLVAALRPGGVLLLEEDDIHPVLATARGDYREAWEAFLRLMAEAGTDPEWARDLPERLGRLGLVDVDAEVQGQLFRGGSDPARFWSLTWHQTRGRALALGIPAEVVDSGRAALANRERWFHGPAKIVTWGHARGSRAR
jgi:SAM-dependent methyltransferase